MRRRLLLTVLAGALVAAACTSTSGNDQAGPVVSAASDSSSTTAKRSTSSSEPSAPKRKKDARPYGEQITLSIESVQRFWAEVMPDAYGMDYEEIPDSRIYAYNEDDLPPACGPEPDPTYEDVAENAFYCPFGDFVAYDDQTLFPQLYSDYGEYAISMVLAHEWGHAIQERVGIIDEYPTILIEQQADCFAGAWTGFVYTSEELPIGETELTAALAGMIYFKDPIGTDPADPGAHGTGFDRVNAFQQGFESGVERCAEYPSDPPQVVDLPLTEVDLDTGGNLPYEDAITAASLDLNEYYTAFLARFGLDFAPIQNIVRYSADTNIPACGSTELTEDQALNHIFFCEEEQYVAWDDTWLADVHNTWGDFSTATLLGLQWAKSFQVQEGVPTDEIESKTGALQQACFTGAWTGDLYNGGGEARSQQITLSAGDLDEVLVSFLAFSEEPDAKASGDTGSAFEKASAFRDGFFGGEMVCDAYSKGSE